MRRFLWIMVLLHANLFGQNSPAKETYSQLEVLYNWTVRESKSITTTASGEAKTPYFLVEKKDGFLVSVEYKSTEGKPATFLLDAASQISFSKLLFQYIPGKGKPKQRLVKITLWNFMGVPTGYVQFHWDNKKIEGRDGNIRYCILYRYSSSIPKGFFPVERRDFIFGGGSLGDDIGKITRLNMKTQQPIEILYYDGDKLTKKEVYDTYNQIFFKQNLKYSFGKLQDEKTVSAQGVSVEFSK